jgi:hypothetical protein
MPLIRPPPMPASGRSKPVWPYLTRHGADQRRMIAHLDSTQPKGVSDYLVAHHGLIRGTLEPILEPHRVQAPPGDHPSRVSPPVCSSRSATAKSRTTCAASPSDIETLVAAYQRARIRDDGVGTIGRIERGAYLPNVDFECRFRHFWAALYRCIGC